MSEVIPFLSEFTTKSTVFEVTSATVDVAFSAALVVTTADASPFVLSCVGFFRMYGNPHDFFGSPVNTGSSPFVLSFVGLLRVQVQFGRYHPDVIRCTVTTGLSAVFPCVGLLRPHFDLKMHTDGFFGSTVNTGSSPFVLSCVGLLRGQVHLTVVDADGWIGCTVAADLSAVSLVLVSIAKLQALTAHIINKRREVVATTFIFIRYYN